MKASVKFREEKCPLLKTKLRFKVGPLPLTSGFSIGTGDELGVHVGTLFPAGPSFTLAFRPNCCEAGATMPTPLALILKTGLGFWGSPSDAFLSLTAEFPLNASRFNPVLFLRLKPQAGDFSISKSTSIAWPRSSDASGLCLLPRLASLHFNKEDSNTVCKGELSQHVDDVVSQHMNGSLHQNAVRSMHAVISGDAPSAIESTIEALSNNETRIPEFSPSGVVDTPEMELKCNTLSGGASLSSYDDNGRQIMFRNELPAVKISLASIPKHVWGSRIRARSLLPLGSSSQLSVRWGIKIPTSSTGQIDCSLSNLPLLIVEKISFEPSIARSAKSESCVVVSDPTRNVSSRSFVEESPELAQVAGLCDSMKQSLHLLYGENKMLRQAMEDMKNEARSMKIQAIGGGTGDVTEGDSKPNFWDVSLK